MKTRNSGADSGLGVIVHERCCQTRLTRIQRKMNKVKTICFISCVNKRVEELTSWLVSGISWRWKGCICKPYVSHSTFTTRTKMKSAILIAFLCISQLAFSNARLTKVTPCPADQFRAIDPYICAPCEKTCDDVKKIKPCYCDTDNKCYCKGNGFVFGPGGTCLHRKSCPWSALKVE